ncbi:hypothetical protein Sjap_002581 [Stephania japonica]|uniref:Uncharacterized protein n=1 Tax=Stephania japonica TaxID=461633 RepID=A0AAP0KMC4_9MAGN
MEEERSSCNAQPLLPHLNSEMSPRLSDLSSDTVEELLSIEANNEWSVDSCRFWLRPVLWESRVLWFLAGASIVVFVFNFMLNFVTLIFTDHLGAEELAGASLAGLGLQGFAYGLMNYLLNPSPSTPATTSPIQSIQFQALTNNGHLNTHQTPLHRESILATLSPPSSDELKEKILCLKIMGVDSTKALSLNPSLHTTTLHSIRRITSFPLHSKRLHLDNLHSHLCHANQPSLSEKKIEIELRRARGRS